MKKFFVLMFAFTTLLSACSQLGNADAQEESDCMISFNFVGEITSSESPLTKTSTNDIIILQVYQGTTTFASGIFDDIQNINLYLKKGQTYKIIICLIKNGKIALGNKYSTTNNSVYTCAYGTYHSGTGWRHDIFNTFGFAIQGDSGWLPVNICHYLQMGTYSYYDNSNTHSLAQKSFTRSGYSGLYHEFINIGYAELNDRYPLCEDWFYGEISNYSPTGEFETVNIDSKRVGFKLKYELSGVTDGEVTVKVYNSKKTFIENTTSTSTYSSDPVFFAFYEARNAWLYADDYMENFTLSVSWLRGIGITEDYGTKTIQLKRNCLNNIKINLGSNDQSAGMNLTVESESTIGAETVTIPVE